jgi:hypothetical protein
MRQRQRPSARCFDWLDSLCRVCWLRARSNARRLEARDSFPGWSTTLAESSQRRLPPIRCPGCWDGGVHDCSGSIMPVLRAAAAELCFALLLRVYRIGLSPRGMPACPRLSAPSSTAFTCCTGRKSDLLSLVRALQTLHPSLLSRQHPPATTPRPPSSHNESVVRLAGGSFGATTLSLGYMHYAFWKAAQTSLMSDCQGMSLAFYPTPADTAAPRPLRCVTDSPSFSHAARDVAAALDLSSHCL